MYSDSSLHYNIHLGIRADTQVRPYNVIIESFHTTCDGNSE